MRLVTAMAVGSLMALVAGGGCTERTRGYCKAPTDCAAGMTCNVEQSRCMPPGPDAAATGGAGGSTDAGWTGDGPPDGATDAPPSGDAPQGGDAADAAMSCSCGDGGPQVCDTHTGTCVGCLGNGDCTAPTALCDPTAKTCVQCLTSNDCKGTAAPVCDHNACVQCATSSDCQSATAPICDAHACRACRADGECPGPGPGVCASDGHCALDSEVIYAVRPSTGSCQTADGTPANPYCGAQEALNATLNSGKRIIVLQGTFGVLMATTTPGQVTVVGKGATTATVNPGSDYGVDVSGSADLVVRNVRITGGTAQAGYGGGAHVSGAAARLTLQNVEISGNTGSGVTADSGATIVMNACVVKGMGLTTQSGLITNASAFRVTNCIFTNNASGASLSQNVPAGKDQVFKNNTLTSNVIGLICSGTFPSGLVFDGNGMAYTPDCMPAACCSGAQSPMLTPDGHLMSTSPCIDQLTPDPDVTSDIDGDPRPYNKLSDCGADEYVPAASSP
jgi:hypothetical protein